MVPRRIVLYSLLVAVIGIVGFRLLDQPVEVDRCERYQPVNQPLIAHAGGGLPTAIYTNRLEAMELAAAHGFRLIELDFWRTGKGISLGHNSDQLSTTTFDQLLDFLRRHPDVSIVTDFKADNVDGLRRIAELAGPLRTRFIPQIYDLNEYQPVMAMGFPSPILTLYRSLNITWVLRANKMRIRAITMPYNQRYLVKLVDHPVYLHTVNQPMPGYGLYTDCLIPATGSHKA
jgi:hypothetical protein